MRLKLAVKRSHQEPPAELIGSIPYSPPCSCPTACGTAFKKREQNSGITVIATRYDANREITTASASAVKRNLLTPYRNVTGKNTTTVVRVAARTAMLTSDPPCSAADSDEAPISRCR